MTNLQGIPGFKIRGYIAGKEYVRSGSNNNLQSRTKVLGTVLQYAYFSVFSRFPLKTVYHFRNFLALPPPPPYTKLKLEKNSGYTRPTLFVGKGRGWTCVNWKTPQKRKSVPRRLSMIVDYTELLYCMKTKS